MSVFQCKMCGGSLNVTEGMTVCECEYCNTKQTISQTKDVQQQNMINRANHFRQKGEFDKAMEIYERMLDSCSDDADIYWSIILCYYGISYVDDPRTGQKIATCHRAQYESVLKNSDFQMVLKYATEEQIEYYKQQAEYIDSIQKGILEISSKEKPYDVFICYKETDEKGERTIDSVIAQDIYDRLEKEGMRVFFARITLEKKLGQAYEPYIFSALNSAKVMLVVGTKAENMQAVWVKNEWSRYISMMKKDTSKSLIPVYKDMDPYDMPDELSFLQSQDMSKIGAIQDLVHGVRKLVGKKNTYSSQTGNNNTGNVNDLTRMLDRIMILLEDSSFDKAAALCEKALDIDTYNGEAFLYKLFAELKVRKWSDLEKCKVDFYSYTSYKLACKYNKPDVTEKLQKIAKQVRLNLISQDLSTGFYSKSIENGLKYLETLEGEEAVKLRERCVKAMEDFENKYREGVSLSKEQENIDVLSKACNLLETVNGYKDASKYLELCIDKIETCKQIDKIQNDLKTCESPFSLQGYIQTLNSITDNKQAKELEEKCQKKLQDIDTDLELARILSESKKINDLKSAIEKYKKVGTYKGSAEKLKNCVEKLEKIEQKKTRKSDRKHTAATYSSRVMAVILFFVLPLFGAVAMGMANNGVPISGTLIIVIALNTIWSYVRSRGFDHCSCIVRIMQIYNIVVNIGIHSLLLLVAGDPFFSKSELLVLLPPAIALVLMVIAEVIGRKFYDEYV